jgi:hypothetical protein
MIHSENFLSTIELSAPDRLLPCACNARTHSQTRMDRIAAIAALERDGCEIEKRGFRDDDAAPLTEHESADVIIRRWQEHTGKCATQEGDGRAFEEVVVRRLPKLHLPCLRGGSRL